MSDEPMDRQAVHRLLGDALQLQAASGLHHTLVAGSLTGLQYAGLASMLASFAAAEADDTRRLVEKLRALGGRPAISPASLGPVEDPESGLRRLVEAEREVVAALHAVIPETGQEPESEALEHLLEHVIMRKQEQVDTLVRALDDA